MELIELAQERVQWCATMLNLWFSLKEGK